jgi:hypothetical protein
MNMVKALLLIVAALLVGQTASAAGCKYQKNETDKFTKVVTRWTKWNPVMSTWHLSKIHHIPYVSVYTVDDDAQLLIKIETFIQEKTPPDELYLEEYLVVTEGAPLLIMMEDGTTIELPALNNVRAVTHTEEDPAEGPDSVTMFRTTGTAIIKYRLDHAAKNTLAGQSVRSITVTTDSSNFDFEIHEKSVDDFATAISCSL